ncbi:hypothetical protein [Kyrpidia sp.]|uniref:hypothetical protein n=1 Tax=Kyrpidia sp. TaxID=2073077 RepID=UPI002585EC40|nr:hypothetical protein [Kyrpidia sp.]MCL6575245.1 hypothetical protein [Kyrpidia sp.]
MEHHRFQMAEELTRRVAQGGPARVIQLSLPAGRVLDKHRVDAHLLAFVLRGRVVFEAFEPGGGPLTLGPAEMIAVGPGVPHRVESLEDAVLALVLVPPGVGEK